MANVELELLSAMLHLGDISPITSGKFRREHCLTNEGKGLYDFIAQYKFLSQGNGRIPTRNAVLSRFDTITPEMLPTFAGTVDLGSMIYEARTVATRAQMREFAQMMGEAAEDPDNPFQQLELARKQLDALLYEASEEEHHGFDTHLAEIGKRYKAGNILPYGIPWPWPSMNLATRGMQRGEFIILSGRPKTRKTFVMLHIGVEAYLNGYRVLVFTPEMHPWQILLRSAALAARLRYDPFKKSELTPDEEMAFEELIEEHAAGAFGQLSEFEEEAEAKEWDEEERRAARRLFRVIKATNRPVSYIEGLIEQYRPDIVLVDSFYRLAGEGARKSDSDHKIQTSISRELKNCASEHEIVMLGTHQINREGDKKIGNLSNLAYTDAFSQDSDLILRILTSKKADGNDLSALVLLGGRETPSDGILINNVPCRDYREVGIITDTKKVMSMLQEDDEEDEGSGNSTKQSLNGARKRKAKAKPPGGFAGRARNGGVSKVLNKKANKTPAKVDMDDDYELENEE